MNSDLRALYQEVIVDHSKKPRNFKKIQGASKTAEGFNPLCGDRLFLYLKIEGDKILEASFVGQGCAISTASASMMTEIVQNKTLAQAEGLFQEFHTLVTKGDLPEEGHSHLGKLSVFAGVSEFPARVKCASLPWHTLKAAMNSADSNLSAAVKTE